MEEMLRAYFKVPDGNFNNKKKYFPVNEINEKLSFVPC